MSLATPGDEQKLKEMIVRFYAVAGQNPPQQLQINDNVASVFITMLQKAAKCSKRMNYVPLPLKQKIAGGSGLVLWVATYV